MRRPLRDPYVEHWRSRMGGSLPSPFRESRSLFPCAFVSQWDCFATSPAPTYIRLVVFRCPCRDLAESRGEGNLAMLMKMSNDMSLRDSSQVFMSYYVLVLVLILLDQCLILVLTKPCAARTFGTTTNERPRLKIPEICK